MSIARKKSLGVCIEKLLNTNDVHFVYWFYYVERYAHANTFIAIFSTWNNKSKYAYGFFWHNVTSINAHHNLKSESTYSMPHHMHVFN